MQKQIRAQEGRIVELNARDETTLRLQSIPGMGKILAPKAFGVGCSSYFGGLYRLHRARGKNANVAITIIARRMCQISWTLLKERRDFYETFFGRSALRLTAAA